MKYLILGAGPAGLSFACRLHEQGENDFLIVEKENVAGGLCRSVEVDGAPFDIGGGHFLDVRRPDVNRFLFKYMPEDEWRMFERNTAISINGKLIGQPIESYIWQMELNQQVEYLKSIAKAGCNLDEPMPNRFIDWIYWKLGDKIANDYMIPYNQKMFGNDLNALGTYWLEKLPNVSFEETLLSCLTHKKHGKDPGHSQFYYPKKYGYGEVWLRMASSISNHIVYNKEINGVDFNKNTIFTSDGDKYSGDYIITSIPWVAFKQTIGMPVELNRSIQKLKSSAIETRYFPDDLNTNSHWIYYPDPDLTYHRILVRHNFCLGSKGYWTETNGERIINNTTNNFTYYNSFAYPLNTIDKPQIMKDLLSWTRKHNVYGLGRWGEHEHYNSDLTVSLAIKLADKFLEDLYI